MSVDDRQGPGAKGVVVLGGGVAGMQAALLLGEMGIPVTLLEEGPVIGGFFPLLDRTFPTNSCGVCFMHPAPPALCPTHECRLHPMIEVITSARVREMKRAGNDFSLEVEISPAFVGPACNGCGLCIEACPVELPSSFGGGLERWKAVHRPIPQALGGRPVIDAAACSRCGACVKACPEGAVNLDAVQVSRRLSAGAVLLGGGFTSVEAGIKGEFGFGRFADVFSAVQFERMLSRGGPSGGRPVRRSSGEPIRRVAFIQCVGSRDPAAGRERCSSICCMFAVKQAMVAMEREPGLEPVIFCMDLRAVGKGYEEYCRKAREKGVEFRYTSISNIREVPGSGRLLVNSSGPDGRPREEEFDAAVLATGFTPPPGFAALAAGIGLRLDEGGFCWTPEFLPARTSVEGIFAAGAIKGPRDIPETVVQASAAAAEAAALVAGGNGNEVPRAEAAPAGGTERQGMTVVVCGCRGLLEKTLDLAELARRAQSLPGATGVRVVREACGGDGLRELGEMLRESGSARVLVAGCSPREAEPLLADTLAGAGVPRSLWGFVNLLEQCALPHADRPREATEKAASMVRMEASRLGRSRELGSAPRPRKREVLVVGGGGAGMTAALRLASMGHPVTLLERSEKLGGNLSLLRSTVKGGDPRSLRDELIGAVRAHPAVTVLTEAEALSCEGEGGDFLTTVRLAGGGEKTVSHGAVILATGAREASAAGFGRGEIEGVMTQTELEEILESGGDGESEPGTLVMIQCAGSRVAERPYCSRVCCSRAVKNALAVRERFPGSRVFVLHRDVRTYGPLESAYREARLRGVVFVRYAEGDLPRVEGKGGRPSVSVTDTSTGRLLELDADMVVLSAGMEASGSGGAAQVFGAELDEHGFVREANPKGAPLDTSRRGVYACGLCHAPNHIEDALAQGAAAAARASAWLAGRDAGEDYGISVVARLCSGCGLCISGCPYEARELNERGTAVVNDARCRGCGACVAACRNGATRQANRDRFPTLAVVDEAID